MEQHAVDAKRCESMVDNFLVGAISPDRRDIVRKLCVSKNISAVMRVYSSAIFSRHPYSHGKPLYLYKKSPSAVYIYMQISELKATNHSQNRNFKNV